MTESACKSPENIAPEGLLDSIEALLKPYIGSSATKFGRDRNSELMAAIRHSVVDMRFRTLLTQHGLPEDIARRVPVYDPSKSADECANQTGECEQYHRYLEAAAISLASGNMQAADGYFESAVGVARHSTEAHSRQSLGNQIDLIEANREEISRVLGEINEEHVQNWQLWIRIAGTRLDV